MVGRLFLGWGRDCFRLFLMEYKIKVNTHKSDSYNTLFLQIFPFSLQKTTAEICGKIFHHLSVILSQIHRAALFNKMLDALTFTSLWARLSFVVWPRMGQHILTLLREHNRKQAVTEETTNSFSLFSLLEKDGPFASTVPHTAYIPSLLALGGDKINTLLTKEEGTVLSFPANNWVSKAVTWEDQGPRFAPNSTILNIQKVNYFPYLSSGLLLKLALWTAMRAGYIQICGTRRKSKR